MAQTPSVAVAKHLQKPDPAASADGKQAADAKAAAAADDAAVQFVNARHAAMQRPGLRDVTRLLRLARPHSVTLTIAFIALCISAAVNLVMPYALGKISVTGRDNIVVLCAQVPAPVVTLSSGLIRARTSLSRCLQCSRAVPP